MLHLIIKQRYDLSDKGVQSLKISKLYLFEFRLLSNPLTIS